MADTKHIEELKKELARLERGLEHKKGNLHDAEIHYEMINEQAKKAHEKAYGKDKFYYEKFPEERKI